MNMRQQVFFSFFFLFKNQCAAFSSSPPTSSQCSGTLFSQILLLDSPRKFSYAARNNMGIANKYISMKTIAHNGNRTSIKGDWSIIFQTILFCLCKVWESLWKKLCCLPGSQVEKFRDEHKHPVFHLWIMNLRQPFSNRCLSSSGTHAFIPLTSTFWELSCCRPWASPQGSRGAQDGRDPWLWGAQV